MNTQPCIHLVVALAAFYGTTGCVSNGPTDKPIAAVVTAEDAGGYPPYEYPEPQQNDDAGAPTSDGGGGGASTGGNGASSEFGAPPPPTQDYVLDNETATSKTTGLMWLRATVDTRYTSGSCAVRCGDLIAAGRDDWRAPTIAELNGILVTRPTCPLIDEDAFPLSLCSWYTSSETASGSGSDFLMLSFYSGEVKSRLEVSTEQAGYPCRCVR